jgi:hypothetical protein
MVKFYVSIINITEGIVKWCPHITKVLYVYCRLENNEGLYRKNFK